MKLFLKIVFVVSISFMVGLLFFSILRILFGLEFNNESNEQRYSFIWFHGIPIAIFLLVTGIIPHAKSILAKILSVVGMAMFSGVSIFFMTLLLFMNMCQSVTIKELYEHKESSSRRIVLREFGCGATDSEPARVHVEEKSTVLPGIVRYNKIDTLSVNLEEWKPLKNAS